MRFWAGDLRAHGWAPPQTSLIATDTTRDPGTSGHQAHARRGGTPGFSTEYHAMVVSDGRWQLVPIWEHDQTANPLRRYGPPEPH